MKMKNQTYDILKYLVQFILPALGIFLGVLFEQIDFVYSNQTLAIYLAFVTFLGSCLQISNSNYQGDDKNDN